MQWDKKGLIYAPDGEFWWAQGYAHLPTVDVVDSNTIRVYFAALDGNRYGRIGYVDLDSREPGRVIEVCREPVLDVGEPGTFDDCGVNPTCVINSGDKKYLYYTGWQRCERTPYMLFAGLAVSDDGKRFERVSRTPILPRTDREPFIRSAITIVKESNIFRGWYVSAVRWITIDSRQYPEYVIRCADSLDGIEWHARSDICISAEREDEFGFGRPWVVKEEDTYKMWYSIRSRIEPYRIGYAESKDGLNWSRKDSEVGIERSREGWDSEMICYPCVVDVKDRRLMFYNGNRHGATGFGYAALTTAQTDENRGL
jgi:predicted GH43/DUF377 family glycosyl hydrolase